MSRIDRINKEVKETAWQQLIYRWVPEYNRPHVQKKRPSRDTLASLKNRLWKELCEQEMSNLLIEFKKYYVTLPTQAVDFQEALNKGDSAVGKCFEGIEQMISLKKRELEDKVGKKREKELAEQKAIEQAKQEEQEKISLEKEKARSIAELAELRSKISSIDFSMLRSGAFTIHSSVDDLLACPELKDDKDLIEFKKKVETLQAQIEDTEEQAKTAKKITEKKQLEVLLLTTQQNYDKLLEQCATTKKTYSEHFDRVNPTILKISRVFRDLRTATLASLKKYGNSYEDQKKSVQAECANIQGMLDEKSILKQLESMEQAIDQKKTEIVKNIAFIETITIDEKKDTPRVKSNKTTQIRKVSIKEDGYRENIEENAKALETIAKGREVHEESLKEAKQASDTLKQLKSKKQIVKEKSVDSLNAILEQTEGKAKEYKGGFWNKATKMEKSNKAIIFQATVANLIMSITESFKEENQGSLKTSIALLEQLIGKIEKNELKEYRTAASASFFCCKSMTNEDRHYFKTVEEKLQQVKEELSELFTM